MLQYDLNQHHITEYTAIVIGHSAAVLTIVKCTGRLYSQNTLTAILSIAPVPP